ncbi:MAG: TonB-dependent siderophore receptor [Acetobacteraceae bacterium]
MVARTNSQPSADLPAFRVLMGSAVGVALAQGVAAQPAPTAPQAIPPAGAAVQLPPISVQGAGQGGYQATVPSLPKLTQPLLDTPQSISVIPQQLMEDQGTTTVRDALRNVPGISLAAGEGGAQGDSLTLRGFSARNDFFLDGMRDFGSYYRDPFNLNNIEVLKGPASIMFGRGSTGGVVNQVSKQPQMAPIMAGTGTVGTDRTFRFTTDINQPLTNIDNAAFRLNLMGNLNGISARDGAEYRRFGIAPSVTFGLGTDTRLTFSYFHQQEDNTPDYGLPWLFANPAPVNRQNFYGFQNDDFLRTQVDIGTIRLEHDFNENVSFRNQFRYANYQRAGRITEPQVAYAGINQNTPLNRITVNRNLISVFSTESFMQNQSDVTVRFNTGPLKHTVVAGIELGRETSDPTRVSYTGVPTTNLLFPNLNQPFTFTSNRISTQVTTTSNSYSAYFVDTIELDEHWDLIAGFRWDTFYTRYKQAIPPVVNLSRTDDMPSWRAAIVYKPIQTGSIYFAYGTSFNPSAESLSLAANTASLAPEKNETFEIGTKWLVNDGRLTLNGSIFQITKLNARVPDPFNSAFNVLGGNQRVRGFEFGVAGNLTEAWEVYAGYAYLNSVVLESTLPATVGQPLGNTPKHTLSVWSTYELPWHGIEIGGGVQYVSSRIASSTPNGTTGLIEVAPGYVTVQAMAKYPISPGIELQLNAYNITNTKYYDLLHPAHVVPGAGPSVLLTTSFKL